MSFKKIKYILIFILFSGISFAQKQTSVKGVVVDSKTGEPLPFVTVMFDGTTIGVNTDFEGQYVLQVDSNIKYKKRSRLLGGRIIQARSGYPGHHVVESVVRDLRDFYARTGNSHQSIKRCQKYQENAHLAT